MYCFVFELKFDLIKHIWTVASGIEIIVSMNWIEYKRTSMHVPITVEWSQEETTAPKANTVQCKL